jgi:hypothetical protein
MGKSRGKWLLFFRSDVHVALLRVQGFGCMLGALSSREGWYLRDHSKVKVCLAEAQLIHHATEMDLG